MKRHIAFGLLGYALGAAAAAYVVAVIAITEPMNWSVFAQGVLVCGPFGSFIGVMVGMALKEAA